MTRATSGRPRRARRAAAGAADRWRAWPRTGSGAAWSAAPARPPPRRRPAPARTARPSRSRRRSSGWVHRGRRRRSSRSNHSTAVRVASRSTSNGRSSPRFAVRSALRAKRGSSATSAMPSTSQRRRNWPSLPAVTIRSSSAVGNGSYGNTLGCALPIRYGTVAARDPRRAVVDQPGQRRGQQVHLDVLALAGRGRGGAARPGSRSSRGCPPSRRTPRCPARYGGPSGSPVRLISPEIAWTIRS